MAWSKLVDLELDDEEKLDLCLPCGPCDTKSKGPDYPWGLRISLTEKELTKLGLDIRDASIGDLVDMRAFAVITSISQNDNGDGKNQRVELQIQKLAIEDEMRSDDD